jgi:hypothetical protein
LKGWIGLADYLGLEKYHHYCQGRVGTQFCTFTKKKGSEWMAVHEGSHFDSFKKLCEVVEYKINKHFNEWVPRNKEKEFVNVQMYLPVIVVQGELLDARLAKRSLAFRSADHIQFRRSVAQRAREANYQIDIIRERFLPRYVSMVEEELQKTAALLRRRSKTIRKAIDQIMEEADQADAGGRCREVLDF